MAEVDRDHIEEALKLIDFEGQIDSSLRGAARERRLDTLVQYILSEFPADTDGLRISTDELDHRVREHLNEASQQPDPVDKFETSFDQLPDEITNTTLERYILGIPLNISPEIPYDKLKPQNHCFEQITMEEWIDKFAEPALEDDVFADQFGQVPNEFETEFSYWEFEYASRDSKHVLEVAEQHLEVILGQLIYCLFPWSHLNRSDRKTVGNRPWSELRLPFVYILRDENGFHSAYFDNDISPRESIQMLKDRQERLGIRYQQIPALDNPNAIEKKIINAFRNLQFGATESNRRQAFLDYWRTIETLCLFGDESMENVIHRVEAVISIEENSDDLLKRRLKEIKNKRNSLVHEKVDVTINNRDTEFLRSLLYQLIPFMIINRKWDQEKIQLWLENAAKPTSNLEHKAQVLERKAKTSSQNSRIIQTILDAR